MLKVVLDTNVLVSRMIASGYSASIVDAARRQEIKLITAQTSRADSIEQSI
jgi:predicted nucleic acid-binding protein